MNTTRGLALAEYLHKFGWVFVTFLYLIGQPAWSAHSPEIGRGLIWLTSQIQADGTLSGELDSIASNYQARSEAHTSLSLLDTTPSTLVLSVTGEVDGNTEYLARRIVALALEAQDASAAMAQLTARQNTDGGFGGYAGYGSSLLDTANALEAFAKGGRLGTTEVQRALEYLISGQQANGAWLDSAGAPSVYLTAVSMHAIWSHRHAYVVDAALAAAEAYLLADQGNDGWRTHHETALALAALLPRQSSPTALENPVNALIAAQAPDGSWDGDVYSTALVVRVLAMAATPVPNPDLGIIQGRILDGDTLLPITGAEIAILGGLETSVQTDAQGRFIFQGLTESEYRIAITLAGYASLTATTTIKTGSHIDLGDIRMLRSEVNTGAGTIRGTVRDALTNAPLAGVQVEAAGLIAETTEDGQYQILNVPSGQVTVTTSLAGYSSATITGQLFAGGLLVYSPSLASNDAEAAALFGTVTDGVTNLPLAGVSISVTGSNIASAETNALGEYRIAPLQAGAIQVQASKAGYDTVSAGGTVFEKIRLAFSPAMYSTGTTPVGLNASRFSGTVVDSTTNTPLPGVTVTATHGGLTTLATTDGAGQFNVGGVVAAEVSLEFDKSGYVATTFSLPVQPLTEEDIGQVRLRPVTVGELLPDLIIEDFDRTQTIHDPQSLLITGTLRVGIRNRGTAPANGGITLTAYYDADVDGVFNAGTDTLLGALVTQDALPVNAGLSVNLPLQGVLPFRDAPVSVWLDSAQSVVESDENNNQASTCDTCRRLPVPLGGIAPKLKWHWSTQKALTIPLVAPLSDTNGDGRINQRDDPAVIFVSHTGFVDHSQGTLRAVSGKTGQLLWSVTDPALRTEGSASPAVGDIDGDGLPEIVMYLYSGGLAAIRHDGTLKWKTTLPPRTDPKYNYGAINLADIDGDGSSEILARDYLFNTDGTLRWKGSAKYHYVSAIAVDLDLDGGQEVLVGRDAHRADGTLLWSSVAAIDFTAVGNFDDDDYPEIVGVRRGLGRVYMLDHAGNILWSASMPGGGGGAPTIADVDGDGMPEIGVAGRSNYVVFKHDGSILWAKTIQDGSNMTGSTVFDFNGDGKSEIVYGDELTLRVYEGATGKVVFSIANRSATGTEYPVVADIDNDGHAELLVMADSGPTGIRAFEDVNDAWMPTRSIWNQYSYHITNINDDGSIPRHEQPSWLTHNTYRLNTFLDRNPLDAPDLTAGRLGIIDNGLGQRLSLTARIGNGGLVTPSQPATVAFHQGDPDNGGTLLGTLTVNDLAPGAYRDVRLDGISLVDARDVYATVDSLGYIQECNEGNNRIPLPVAGTPALGAIVVVTDSASYASNRPVAIQATVTNTGHLAAGYKVGLDILGMDDAVVEALTRQSVNALASGTSAGVSGSWNTGGTYAGNYRVRATLYDIAGRPLATAYAPFAIASGATTLATQLVTDKTAYALGETAYIRGRVGNVSGNLLLNGLTLKETLTQSDGTVIDLGTRPLPELAPAAANEQVFGHLLNPAPVGTYTVKQTVMDVMGQTLDTRQTTFEILSSAATGTGLTGTLDATPESIQVGDLATITYTARNQGNTTLAGLPLTITLLDPVAQQVLAEFSQTADLAINGVYAGSQTWPTAGRDGDVLVAVLTATVAGRTLTLAQDNFVLVKPPIELAIDQTVAGQARLLVLASCEADPHDPEQACDRARADAIAALLDGLGVRYRIVTNVDDFEAAFRSGVYDVYWLSGKQDKFANDLAAEVREAIYRGDSLLVDGTHDERNHLLDEAEGVSYQGKQGDLDLIARIDGPWFAATSLVTAGRADTLALQGATAQATLAAKAPTPAIVSHAYGAGRSLGFAFDLIASHAQEPAWADILAAGIGHLLPATPDSLTGGAYLPILTRLRNLGIATDVRVTAQLPAGASVLDSTPAATLDARTATWPFPLPETAEQDLLLGLTVPLDTGDYTLTTVVDTLDGGVASQYGPTLEYAFSVRALAERLPDARMLVQALPVTRQQERQRRDQALAALDDAEIKIGQGDDAGAIDALLTSVDRLRDIRTADTTEARQAVDELLKETEARWYRNRAGQ